MSRVEHRLGHLSGANDEDGGIARAQGVRQRVALEARLVEHVVSQRREGVDARPFK